MDFLTWIIIGILLAYFIFDKFLLKKKDRVNEEVKVSEDEKLPYKVKDNFLTNTESSFYHLLKQSVGDKAVICPKVGLKDIFFIGKGIGKDYMKYFGKIAQKHVDFLLCDPSTMKPLCGIELDDISHTNKKSYERDLFVEKVYKDANFELIRLSSKHSKEEIEEALTGLFDQARETPDTVENNTVQNSTEPVLCPKCRIPMVLRKANKGANAGKEFYGCPNYPQCKQVISI